MQVQIESSLGNRDDFSWWHVGYGGILAALLVGSSVVATRNANSLFPDIINGLRSEFPKGLAITFGVYALFSVLEHVVPAAGPRKPLAGYWLNLKVHLLESLVAPVLGGLAGASIATIGSRIGLGWIDLRFSTGHGIIDLVLAFLLSVCIYDFFFYWFHRFQHESFLWQEHKLHHMDEQLCAFSRESWIEPLLSGLLTGIPLAILFKFNPEQGAITGTLFLAWNTFIHSNIRLHFGPLGVLFNGPQGHRIHHSRVREHYDMNYAAFFPIWDVLFGTYHYPKRNEYPLTGVHDEREVASLRKAATLPFDGWWQMFLAWRDRKAFSA